MWRRGSVIASWLLDLTAARPAASPATRPGSAAGCPTPARGAGRCRRRSTRRARARARRGAVRTIQSRGEADSPIGCSRRCASSSAGTGRSRQDAARTVGRAGLLRRERRPRLQGHLPGAARDWRRPASSTCPSSASRDPPGAVDDLIARARASVEAHGERRRAAFAKLAAQLRLHRRRLPRAGDVHAAPRGARPGGAPAALPRHSAEPVRRRRAAGWPSRAAADGARVVVEKPFGRDLESARALDAVLHEYFPRACHLPDRPLPGQGAGPEPAVLPVRQQFLEPVWNRDHIDRIEITMAEGFGVKGRGRLYEELGRDARRGPEPPAADRRAAADGAAGGHDPEAIRDAKSQAFRAMRPDRSGRGRPRPVRRLPGRAGRRRRLEGRDVRRDPAARRFVAVGGRARSTSAPARVCR